MNASPSKIVPQQMKQFIKWFNNTAPGKPNEIKFPPAWNDYSHKN